MTTGISVAVHLLPAAWVVAGAEAVALGLLEELELVGGAEVPVLSELDEPDGLADVDVDTPPVDVVEPCDPVGGGLVLAALEHPAVSAAVPIAQAAAKTEIRFMGPNLPG